MQLFPLRIVSDNPNIAFMRFKDVFISLSVALTFISIITLFVMKLNFGIDFTGGVVIEGRSANNLELGKIRHILNDLNVGEISIQNFGDDKDFVVRVGLKDKNADGTEVADKVKNEVSKFLEEKVEYRKQDFVGPQVGSQLISSGVQALVLSFLGIMLYVWVRFEWQFGVGVLIALLHDVILTLGFLSVTHLDFNLSTIAALLTIIGYSVNDSVVIYDRIRENLRKYKNKTIEQIIDLSINETLSRTTLTILTTLIANLALIIWGGEAIKSFSVTVFMGIIIGTYSSICISAPILKLFGLERFK